MEEALEDIRNGRFLVVVDDESRENEGDLVLAAEKATPEAINFMAYHARGLVCMPVIGERLDELNIPLMVDSSNSAKHGTAFTVSIDYKKGTTTGISAQDRAATIRAITDPDVTADDFLRPGHMLPLRYEAGGVLARPGHTEAAIDLARLAGLYPAGVVCEIMNADGTMSRMPELETFSAEHDLKLITVAQIIAYRRRAETLVRSVAEARLPTERGLFRMVAFEGIAEPGEHVALVMGNWEPDEPILVRIHSECLTGEVFGSLRCDCGAQMNESLNMIVKEGKGVFLYMRQEGRGIGLHNKVKAYHLQDTGMDTVEANHSLGFAADMRHYGMGAQMLLELGVHRVRLLTNSPRKMVGLSGYGLEIVSREPIDVQVGPESMEYMRVKRTRMGHMIGY
jgi:3,4-dihydroxy 2-butanone 4-phosphate synthase/GTP cyclohydrolase II